MTKDVSALIDQQAMAIDETMAQAESYLNQLKETANVQFGALPFNVDTLVGNYGYRANPTLPNPIAEIPLNDASRPTIDSSLAVFPDNPEYSFSELGDIIPPDFDVAAPSIDFPTAPSAALPTSPGAAPSFASPSIPDAPTVTLPASPVLDTLVFPDALATPSVNVPDAPVANFPAVPTFESLALPTAPSIDLPSFTSALPTDDLTAPTAEFSFYEVAYSSTLLDPLKAKLLDDLTNGGYGIETADEVALFNRARDREIEAMLSRISDAGRAMAIRGFPLPPGELSIYVDSAYQDMQDKVSSASRDITLERSKLYVDNRRFTITETREVEQILIGFHNSVQERALNAAKATVEMTIAVFKALVERYSARLGAYRAEAEAFANRIRGELAKAEIYRTEVEAVNVQSQVQSRQVDLYRAQIEAEKLPVDIYRVKMDAAKVQVDIEQVKTTKYRAEVEAVGVQAQVQQRLIDTYLAQLKGIQFSVDVFRTRMEAAGILAGVERTRLDAFRAQVEAYSAQVGAKVAEFGMFRAQIEGQKSKVDIFDAQVRAYNGQVSAKKIEADVRTSRLQSEAEQVRAMIALYQGKVAGYEAALRAQMEKGRLETDIYRADVEANRNDVTRAIGSAEVQVKVADLISRESLKTQDTAVEAARLRLQAAIEAMKIRTAATNFAADKFFALLTAMQSSMNTLAIQSSTVSVRPIPSFRTGRI